MSCVEKERWGPAFMFFSLSVVMPFVNIKRRGPAKSAYLLRDLSSKCPLQLSHLELELHEDAREALGVRGFTYVLDRSTDLMGKACKMGTMTWHSSFFKMSQPWARLGFKNPVWTSYVLKRFWWGHLWNNHDDLGQPWSHPGKPQAWSSLSRLNLGAGSWLDVAFNFLLVFSGGNG